MAAVFPLLAAVIAAVFCVRLGARYRSGRRAATLAWTLSLGLYACASLAAAVGVAIGWAVPLFGVYWLAGALLNVPLLAVGQLLLADPGRARLWWFVGGLVVLVGAVATLTARFDAGALAAASRAGDIPRGRDVLGGSAAYTLARPFSFTFVVVVAGSLWSAWRARRPAIACIAVGVTVVAASSVAVRVGQGQVFAILLAAGVAVMYAGFLASTRPPRARPQGRRRSAHRPR